MQIKKEELLQQRWSMLTNPTIQDLPILSPVTELEIIENSMFIDSVCEGHQLTNNELCRCRMRFRSFCNIQWRNRSRN